MDQQKEDVVKSNWELSCEVCNVLDTVEQLDQLMAMMERKICNIWGKIFYDPRNQFLKNTFNEGNATNFHPINLETRHIHINVT